MNQGPIWGRLLKKTRGRQSRATVPLKDDDLPSYLKLSFPLQDTEETRFPEVWKLLDVPRKLLFFFFNGNVQNNNGMAKKG